MAWWFGRKGAVAAGRPQLVRWGEGPAAGRWPLSYEAQVRDAYCANPVAQRAVRMVAEAAGSIAPYAAAGEAAAARLLTPDLLETAATHLLLHGNAFVRVLEDAGGRPAALHALRPERVTIETGADGWPAAYRYRAGERIERIAAEATAGRRPVAHLRAAHPLDDHYGLGCLGAAAGAVAIHNAATRWNKALLDNAARPSGAVIHAPGDGQPLSGEQHERLRAALDEAFAGAANAGRPLLLDGGLSWQPLGLTPAEMDFAGLKAAAARDIALAFGVPPMLLGLPGDATYANYREANRALWRLTVLPMAEKMVRALGDALAGWWPGTRIAIDVDQLSALAEDRERLWAAVGGADFLTRAEKRAMLGFAEAAA